MQIDLNKLVELEACAEGILRFRHNCPNGIELDTSRRIFIDADSDVFWILENLKFPSFSDDYSSYKYRDGQLVWRKCLALGTTTYMEYDDHGNLAKERYSNGGYTEMFYDEGNRLIKAMSHGCQSVIDTRWKYDERGQLLEKWRGGQLIEDNAYDKGGRLTTSRRGDNITQFLYDERGNLILEKFSSGRQIEYTYDEHNRVISEKYRGNRSVWEDIKTYNERGDLATSTYISNLGCPDTKVVTTFDYDEEGRLLSKTSSDGEWEEYDKGIIVAANWFDQDDVRPYGFKYMKESKDAH